MLQGQLAFVPIAHSHPIYMLTPETGATFEQWMAMDLEMLDYCKAIWVLCLDGWDTSHGVTEELKYAASKGYTIKYLDPKDYV